MRIVRQRSAWPGAAIPALPADPTIEELSDADRQAVAAVWSGRARGELSTAQTFAVIAEGLVARKTEPEVTWLATKAVSDEVQHAEICRRVASAYLGRDAPWPAPRHLERPRIGGGPELASTVFVVFHCCMNETIATAFLRSCQGDAQGPLVRAALRELLRTEIDSPAPDVDPPRGHGCPPHSGLADVVEDAIRDLVLPGFRHVGIVIDAS